MSGAMPNEQIYNVRNSNKNINDDCEELDCSDEDIKIMEVLSPRPPPDNIGAEELAAIVISGPIISRRHSMNFHHSTHLFDGPNKSSNVSSSFHNLCNTTVLNAAVAAAAESAIMIAPSAVPKSSSDKQKQMQHSQQGGSFFSRLFCCVSRMERSFGEVKPRKPIISNHEENHLDRGCGDTAVTVGVKCAVVEVDIKDDDFVIFHKSVEQVEGVADSNEDLEKNNALFLTQLLPPKGLEFSKRKCLVVDLDETLVHSSFTPVPNADFEMGVEIENRIHRVYVLKRPFNDEFLEKMAPLYEMVLFTASLSKYADPVTDFVDPRRHFKHRLFRDSCCYYNGNYVKDLGLLGRDVNDVIILDNSPVSYLFHNQNAVHVLSWFDNPQDRALHDLIPFFERLAVSHYDVPTFLAQNPPPASATGSSPRNTSMYTSHMLPHHHTPSEGSNPLSYIQRLTVQSPPIFSNRHQQMLDAGFQDCIRHLLVTPSGNIRPDDADKLCNIDDVVKVDKQLNNIPIMSVERTDINIAEASVVDIDETGNNSANIKQHIQQLRQAFFADSLDLNKKENNNYTTTSF